MKRACFILQIFLIISVTVFAQNGITITFSPIEGNMKASFKSSIRPFVEEKFSEGGFNLYDDKEETIATHMLIVSANKWEESVTSADAIALSVFNNTMAALSGTATRNVGIENRKEIVEKYRISAKIIDLESTYVVASSMAQGNIDSDPNKLSEDVVKGITKQLSNIKKKKKPRKNPFSIACMPPEGNTNYMSVESKLPYLMAVEAAFINRGDNVGDRNRLDDLMKEFGAQYMASKKTDPINETLKVGEVMQVSYFASVVIDTWVESKTSGLDVFNAIAGTATAAAAGESAKNLGGEQNKDIVQMVRVTIKILDVETSYIVAAGVAQGEISDEPVNIANAAMKDLEKQLKTIEKRKLKMEENAISVACLPASGNMDDTAKTAYISAIEVSLIKGGYKVADRNKLAQIMIEINRQRKSVSVIAGEALEVGKIMNITHFVFVTADTWDEEHTSGLDVFKTVASTATAVAASDTMATGGGKESRDIVANARLGLKIVSISDGIVLALGMSDGKMSDKPIKLSDNVLKQVATQIKKQAKAKKDNNVFLSCEVSGGSLDKKSILAYLLSTEQEMINQNLKIIDNSIKDEILGEEIVMQRALNDKIAMDVQGKNTDVYKIYISVDTWEEQSVSGLSITKSIFGVVANTLAEQDTSGGSSMSDETADMATTKHVRYTVKIVDPQTQTIIFEGNSEGLLKDKPSKLVSKALKKADKSILDYQNK